MTEEYVDRCPLLEPALGRQYSDAFRAVWPAAVAWVDPYYDSVHLRQAVIWLLRLASDAPEELVLAALTHDMERHFPDPGQQLDKSEGAWDDLAYNTYHAARSGHIVSGFLRSQGAPQDMTDGVLQPILQHEFGGSPNGDLMQAADSLSFLETNADLVASWVLRGETSVEHARAKLDWMYERIRLDDARGPATRVYIDAIESFDRQLAAAN